MFRTFLPNLRNVSIGAFCGACLGVCFMLLIESPLSENYVKYGIYGIGALVALLGSGLALAGVLANIDNQNRLAEEENKKSLLAARAALPPVLASLNSKAEAGYKNAVDFETQKSWEIEFKEESVEKSSISASEIAVLQECIKYADSISARWLSLIVAHFQIQASRLEGSLTTSGLIKLEGQVADDAINWRILSAMIAHMFEFSRTGKKPEEFLPENTVNIAVDVASKNLSREDLEKARSRKVKYIEETHGWTSTGFQNALVFDATSESA